jgi:hypothetical protein
MKNLLDLPYGKIIYTFIAGVIPFTAIAIIIYLLGKVCLSSLNVVPQLMMYR